MSKLRRMLRACADLVYGVVEMGRPKLARTKEQIAIRLAPGTKARLESLMRMLRRKGQGGVVRSEVLRVAIERGIAALEADVSLERTIGSAAAGLLTATPTAAPISVRSARSAPEPPARPPKRMLAPLRSAPKPQPARSREAGASVIPGTLAERALRQMQRLGSERGEMLNIADVCRAAWPPNPHRVHEALLELEQLGVVELCPADARSGTPRDQALLMKGAGGALLGYVRLS
jgi:hypothetical protein